MPLQNEITLSPMHRRAQGIPSTSAAARIGDIYLIPNTRSGRDLWKTVRIKMLSFKTQQHLMRTTTNGRRLSVVCDGVTRILRRSDSNKAALRRLKYGSSAYAVFLQLMDECGDFITMMIKKTQTPGKHAPWFTMCMVAIYVAIFEFMASEWSILSEGSSWSSGPHNLFRYLDANSHPTQFSSVFLIAWGAQDLRLIVIERQSYRWFTSPFLHVSIVHCMSNVIMYIFFGTVVERTYGPLVAIFIWFAAATMGSFMAGACGQPCVVLVGASGAVFGYFGFFCADTGLRWNIIKRPTIRILFILMFTAQAIYSIVSDKNVSYWAHIGGCLAGVCCSALLVKHVKTLRRRRLLLVLAGLFVAVFWIVFPTVVYATAKRYEICVN